MSVSFSSSLSLSFSHHLQSFRHHWLPSLSSSNHAPSVSPFLSSYPLSLCPCPCPCLYFSPSSSLSLSQSFYPIIFSSFPFRRSLFCWSVYFPAVPSPSQWPVPCYRTSGLQEQIMMKLFCCGFVLLRGRAWEEASVHSRAGWSFISLVFFGQHFEIETDSKMIVCSKQRLNI